MAFSLCAPETKHSAPQVNGPAVTGERLKTEPGSDASPAAVIGAANFPEQPPSSDHDAHWPIDWSSVYSSICVEHSESTGSYRAAVRSKARGDVKALLPLFCYRYFKL